MNCHSCEEISISLRQRAPSCKACIEQYLNKLEMNHGKEILVKNILA